MLSQWVRENEQRELLFNLKTLALSDLIINITSTIIICRMYTLNRYKYDKKTLVFFPGIFRFLFFK